MTTMNGIKQVSDTVWEIPVDFKKGMRVPARLYGTEKLIRQMDEAVYDQITNVATLPGITRHAYCMPDGHCGYGLSHWGRGRNGCELRRSDLARWNRFRHQLWNATGQHQSHL